MIVGCKSSNSSCSWTNVGPAAATALRVGALITRRMKSRVAESRKPSHNAKLRQEQETDTLRCIWVQATCHSPKGSKVPALCGPSIPILERFVRKNSALKVFSGSSPVRSIGKFSNRGIQLYRTRWLHRFPSGPRETVNAQRRAHRQARQATSCKFPFLLRSRFSSGCFGTVRKDACIKAPGGRNQAQREHLHGHAQTQL